MIYSGRDDELMMMVMMMMMVRMTMMMMMMMIMMMMIKMTIRACQPTLQTVSCNMHGLMFCIKNSFFC